MPIINLHEEPYVGLLAHWLRWQPNELHRTPVSLVEITAQLISAYLASNKVSADDLPRLIEAIHRALEKFIADPDIVDQGLGRLLFPRRQRTHGVRKIANSSRRPARRRQ